MTALSIHDAAVCACGMHPSIARDKSNVASIEHDTCPFCAGLAVRQRVKADEDEVATQALAERMHTKVENLPASTPLPGDGRRTYLRLLPPE